MRNFTVGKIRRSLQRSIDFVSDLSRSDMNTFDDRLSLLVSYCQNDEGFEVIDRQLAGVMLVSFDTWYNRCKIHCGLFANFIFSVAAIGMRGISQICFFAFC